MSQLDDIPIHILQALKHLARMAGKPEMIWSGKQYGNLEQFYESSSDLYIRLNPPLTTLQVTGPVQIMDWPQRIANG